MRLLAVLSVALLAACKPVERSPPPAPSGDAPPAASLDAPPAASGAAAAPPRRKAPAPAHEGGALVRSAEGDALYLAHEDLGVVRRIPLPLTSETKAVEVGMPGPPAAVLALADRVLVTVRGVSSGGGLSAPGLLLVMRPDDAKGLVEVARVELPGDAWGVAVTPDERIALVTSAWTHQVSAIDVAAGKKLWSVDVPREPRAVVAMPDGKSAYVTHLVSASLTRIDGLDGAPSVRRVPFPAAPLRVTPDRAEAATLGYAAALSPDGSRLFVPRQALGATGWNAWNGQATVDVLLTAGEAPLAVRPKRWFVMESKPFQKAMSFARGMMQTRDPHLSGPGPVQQERPFVQPRAMVYRRSARTLLVASEGSNELVELDALSVDPSVRPLQVLKVGAAPSGVALSEDERTAYVFCRGDHRVTAVPLEPTGAGEPAKPSAGAAVTLAADPLPEKAARGRRLFYDANDGVMSERYACAGCHPEGRDDGHVWQEDFQEDSSKKGEIRILRMHAFPFATRNEDRTPGTPRQTPMLAGRVAASGPYGWKGESKTLRHRIQIGFSIHHTWGGGGVGPEGAERAEALVEFLRDGLVPPPREDRPLTDEEQRGRRIFDDPNVGCATCHVPKTEYTNRAVVGLGPWIVDKKRFEPEAREDWRFKTPSLRYVGGTPPYYHDGSSSTLEELLERNGDRMGHTKHLFREDRAALAAFLRTL
jgi:cytochrome c peroxidase